MMKFTISIMTAFAALAAGAPPHLASFHHPLPCGNGLPFLRSCPHESTPTTPNSTPTPTTLLPTTTLAPVLLTAPSTPTPSTTMPWAGPRPFDHLASFHLPLPCGTGLPFLRPCPPAPTPTTTTNPTPLAPTTLQTKTSAPTADDLASFHVHLPLPCGAGLPFLRPCPPAPTPTTLNPTPVPAPTTLQTTPPPTPPLFPPPSPCTTTFFTNIPHRHNVQISYASTITATETVDCKGCEAVSLDWEKVHHWAHGPVVFGSETGGVTTSTERVCKASARG